MKGAWQAGVASIIKKGIGSSKFICSRYVNALLPWNSQKTKTKSKMRIIFLKLPIYIDVGDMTSVSVMTVTI